MRHEHERAGIVGEECLEPDDRVDIEVVGRFIEQQHIRFAGQRPRQQHAPPPSARQRIDADIRRKFEAGEHELDALFDAPGISPLEVVLKAAPLLGVLPAENTSEVPDEKKTGPKAPAKPPVKPAAKPTPRLERAATE